MSEHATPGREKDDTLTGDDLVRLTVRLLPDVHHGLAQIAEQTGESLNTLVNKYCRQAMIPPGGTAQIARMRRRLPPRSEPARAALSYLLSYFGKQAEARRVWPWHGKFSAAEGDTASLVLAGALAAVEIDKREGRPWGTQGRLSASAR